MSRVLPGDLLLLLGRLEPEGLHVVQPVRELHQDHPDVRGHGQDHFPHVLRFPLLGGAELDLADLGDPVHDLGDLRAEEALDLGKFGLGILDGVVEDAGRHGHHVHLHAGQEVCDLQRMGKVGLTGQTDLPLVDLGRIHIGLLTRLISALG